MAKITTWDTGGMLVVSPRGETFRDESLDVRTGRALLDVLYSLRGDTSPESEATFATIYGRNRAVARAYAAGWRDPRVRPEQSGWCLPSVTALQTLKGR